MSLKYIKLYEEAGSAAFEPVDDRKWPEFIKNIISFDTSKLSVFPEDLKSEIKKTVTEESNVRRRRQTDEAKIPKVVNYLIVYIDEFIVFVYEKEDEYYGVFTERKRDSKGSLRKSLKFKCDQIDGVIQCLDHIKTLK